MENQFDDSKDNSAATSFFSVIGRMGTNRLKLELLDDARDKADSVKFDNNHILTKKFLECKSKSKTLVFYGEYYFGTYILNYKFIFQITSKYLVNLGVYILL
jgi:hypothetical protein